MPEVKAVTFEPGYIVVQTDSGPPTRYPLSDVLVGSSIPTLTETESVTKVPSLVVLAHLVELILKTLLEAGILKEGYFTDYSDEHGVDIDYLIDRFAALGITF